MIEIGTLDRITAVIGERGTGKSTLAKLDARSFQRETGGYVIGHSPNGQIGRERDITFHDSLKSLERGLRKNPERMHFVATGVTPEGVIDYGRRLGYAMRRDAHKRAGYKFRENRPAPRGLLASPVLVIIDEGTHSAQTPEKRAPSREEVLSTSTLRELEKFLTSARHEHVALTWLIQAPTRRSWVYQEQANRFRVFRYMHEWGLNAIRAAAIPKEALESIRRLPKFSYYALDKDDPDSAHFARLPPP